jgi:hypothetical protein
MPGTAGKSRPIRRQTCRQPRSHAPQDVVHEPDPAGKGRRRHLPAGTEVREGTNRGGASRLHQIARVLDVPISFIFEHALKPGQQFDARQTR